MHNIRYGHWNAKWGALLDYYVFSRPFAVPDFCFGLLIPCLQHSKRVILGGGGGGGYIFSRFEKIASQLTLLFVGIFPAAGFMQDVNIIAGSTGSNWGGGQNTRIEIMTAHE